MSIHEILKQDNSYHFIQEEHKGIKYFYASNIQEDEVFAIIKYFMPLEIEKCFQRKDPSKQGRDTLYITLEKEVEKYYLNISVATSENLERSHTEVLRVCMPTLSDIVTQFTLAMRMESFTVKTINAINGGAVALPLYISPIRVI